MKEYKEEFFKKFLSSHDLKTAKESFSRLFGKPVWWVTDKKINRGLIDINQDFLKSVCHRLPKEKLKECKGQLIEVFDKAERTKKIVKFRCSGGKFGFCMPLFSGDRMYGFVSLCNVNKSIAQEVLDLFVNFIHTILGATKKELELSKLYDTIRPRAIALSTIHTIHRLISSTLNIDELIPRIARLSLQILRARKCSIMLLDERRRFLNTAATIDLDKKKAILKKIKLGRQFEGKVAKSSQAILKKYVLAVPLIDEDVIGVITVRDRIDHKGFSIFDQEILTTLAEQAVIAIKNAQLYKEQENITIGSIKSLGAILDTKYPYTYTHSGVFENLVLALGKELNLSNEELRYLHYAALMPDAGKFEVPDRIIKKRTRLTDREFRIIKEHPQRTVNMLRHIEILKPALPIILHHHERFDGRGYPDGLLKDKIPVGSRILAVADAFEAMIYQRPYRKTKTIQQALEEIIAHSGTQFDPKVVDAFLKIVKNGRLKQILSPVRNNRYKKITKQNF